MLGTQGRWPFASYPHSPASAGRPGRRLTLNLAVNRGPVDVRRLQVAEDQVVLPPGDSLERRLAAVDGLHRMAVLLEHRLDQLRQLRLIVQEIGRKAGRARSGDLDSRAASEDRKACGTGEMGESHAEEVDGQ